MVEIYTFISAAALLLSGRSPFTPVLALLDDHCVGIAARPFSPSSEHLAVYLLHHVIDEFVNVGIELGRGLKVWHLVLIGEEFGVLIGDNTLVFKVYLVPHECLHDVGVRMLVNTLEPVLHIGEGGLIRDVEAHYHTVSLLVEGVSNSAETLLTCCVPNLYGDLFSRLGRLESCRNVVKPDCGHM